MEETNEETITEDEQALCSHCGKRIRSKAVVKGFSVICPYCDSPL